MQTGKLLLSSIIGTTAMTLFSYLASESKNKNFNEPDILGSLIKRLPKNISKDSAELASWILHYAIGIIFDLIYIELIKRNKLITSVLSGTIFGTLSGLVGIVAWESMFEAHPNPPIKSLKKYFRHLILAQIVFDVFIARTYNIALTGNQSLLK